MSQQQIERSNVIMKRYQSVEIGKTIGYTYVQIRKHSKLQSHEQINGKFSFPHITSNTAI